MELLPLTENKLEIKNINPQNEIRKIQSIKRNLYRCMKGGYKLSNDHAPLGFEIQKTLQSFL